MRDNSTDGIRRDLAVIYEKLSAIQRDLYWFSSAVEWMGLIALVLLRLILWRVW